MLTDIRHIHEINQRIKGCNDMYIFYPQTGCALSIYHEKTFDKYKNVVMARPLSINVISPTNDMNLRGSSYIIVPTVLYSFTKELKKSSNVELTMGEDFLSFNTTDNSLRIQHAPRISDEFEAVANRIYDDIGEEIVGRILSCAEVSSIIMNKDNPYFTLEVEGFRVRCSKSEVGTINGKEPLIVTIYESKSLSGYHYAKFSSSNKLFNLWSIVKFKNF